MIWYASHTARAHTHKHGAANDTLCSEFYGQIHLNKRMHELRRYTAILVNLSANYSGHLEISIFELPAPSSLRHQWWITRSTRDENE